ncbi:MAG: DUF885 domain-containing protein, partial [Proteobacteria bacterium]|nr:DUF885 domain-containing protein [Pseudomonadota bacterium]
MLLSRRTLFQSSAASLALVSAGCSATPTEAPEATLSAITEQLLNDYPEGATSAGVDTGARAALRGKLTDRSGAGQQVIAAQVGDALARLERIDLSRLQGEWRTHVDVVRTAYEIARDGFAFPFGDVAILDSNWSYRNSPYVLSQNVG